MAVWVSSTRMDGTELQSERRAEVEMHKIWTDSPARHYSYTYRSATPFNVESFGSAPYPTLESVSLTTVVVRAKGSGMAG